MDAANGMRLINAAMANNVNEIMNLVSKKKTNVNFKNSLGETPLMIAAMMDRRNAVSALFSLGADVFAQNNDGRTALHKACEYGHADVTHKLLFEAYNYGQRIGDPDMQAQLVNVQDSAGRTALHYACAVNSLPCAEWLVHSQADPALRDQEGKLAVDLAEDPALIAFLQRSPLSGAESSHQESSEHNDGSGGGGVGVVEGGGGPDDRLQPDHEAGPAQEKQHSPSDTAESKRAQELLALALAQGRKEWRRSKLSVVGEGRAGKTALTNSIIGRAFEETASTVGINQLTCDVRQIKTTQAGEGQGGAMEQRWGECVRVERELEAALAEMVLRGLRDGTDASTPLTAPGDANIVEFMRSQEQKQQQQRGASLSVEAEVGLDEGHGGGGEHLIQEGKVAEVRAQESTGVIGVSGTGKEDAVIDKAEELENDASPTTVAGIQHSPKVASAERDSGGASTVVAAADEEMVMKMLATMQDADTGLLISLFDFGGQTVFDVIHHLFLTRNGVYALVFNMEWLVNDGPERDKALRFLRNWLSSIAVHTLDPATGLSAPVVFVGTRLDLISSGAEHERISTTLYETFSDHLAWRSVIENDSGRDSNGRAVQWFFPVDNKQGKDGPTLKHLMSVVHAAMDAAAYMHKEVPLSWLRLMDAMAASGKDCLPYAEVVAIGAACSVGAEEVPLLLAFLNDMGHLLWVDEPELRDVVVLDPVSYLVTPATIIICKLSPDHDDTTHHFMACHRECDKLHKREWTQLKQNGVLSVKLLPVLWRQYEAHTASLVLLMVKYGLLVPLREPSPRRSGAGQHAPLTDRSAGGAAVSQYLVPTLLSPAPTQDPAVVEWTDRPFMTGYFVFTLHDDLETSSTLTGTELRASGFLPTGLFERLLGKALSWSQETARNGGINLKAVLLHRDLAVLSFGGQRFRLVNCADIHSIRVDVEGSHPLGVLNRLAELIEKIRDECLRHLRCFPAVRYSCTASELNTDDPLGEQLPASDMLIPLSQLRLAARGESMLAWWGGRALLSVPGIKTQYGPWLQMYDLRAQYDVFISYRWGLHDSSFTERLFDMFTNFSLGADQRAVEVFLDTKRLQNGRRFKSDFAAALTHSSVIVPVVSCAALERMHDHSPDVVDNVLLEWVILLQCAAAQRVHKVYPIVFGRRQASPDDGLDASSSGVSAFTDFFMEYAQHPLPEIVPTATLAQASELLEDNRVSTTRQFYALTVAGIVRELLQFMLCKASDIHPSEVVEVFAEGVVALLTEVDCKSNPLVHTAVTAPVGAQQGVAATTVAVVEAPTGAAVTGDAAANHEPVHRRLEDLTPSEVGQLMTQSNLEPLRKLFVSREVSGLMLSFVEVAADLLTEEYGLTSAGLAKGLLAKIQGWREHGVLL